MTFWDPPLSNELSSPEADSISYSLAKDAHFNVLSGTQGESGIDHGFAGMVRALAAASRVGLQYLLTDNRFYEAYFHKFDRTIGRTIVAEYRQLPVPLPNAILGYNICDEPHFKSDHLENVSGWKWFLESADPNRLVYLNLAPCYAADQNWGGFRSGDKDGILDDEERKEYELYLTYYVDHLRPAVVSFDHYPFFADGLMRRDYFYNLRIIREKAGSTPFWACPMTTGHYDYADPQRPHIYFMYFSPLAYGARGLAAFTFWPPPLRGYRSGLFDQQGRKTELYDVVRGLNLFVSRIISPVIMRIQNTSVFHASSYPFDQMYIESEIASSSSLIKSLGDRRLMAGIFSNSEETYLLVVNKSLGELRNVAITVRGKVSDVFLSPRVAGFSISSDTSYARKTASYSAEDDLSTFEIPEFDGGEGRLVRLR